MTGKDFVLRRILIKQIRCAFAAKSKADPNGAKLFLEDVQKEEGNEFAELMLDGIFEKVQIGNVPFKNPSGTNLQQTFTRKCRRCGQPFQRRRKAKNERFVCSSCKSQIASKSNLKDGEK